MSKHPIFITGNQHKADYLARILGIELEHQSLELDEIQSVDPIEIVTHKVKLAYDIVKAPVLIEDTSLCFNALDGLPGPFVKFFRTAKDGNEMMCRMLDGFNDRTAYASAVYAYYDGMTVHTFTGKLQGVIAEHPRGDNGYGWDAIFEPEGYGGRTRAELSPKEDSESYAKIRDYPALRAFLEV
jgi:non-canonical purine NTP pyrophosphatase (RdgB/HAM1 family)